MNLFKVEIDLISHGTALHSAEAVNENELNLMVLILLFAVLGAAKRSYALSFRVVKNNFNIAWNHNIVSILCLSQRRCREWSPRCFSRSQWFRFWHLAILEVISHCR